MRTVAAVDSDALDLTGLGRVFDLGADGPDVVIEPLEDVERTGIPAATRS